jgi:hypothetical protein
MIRCVNSAREALIRERDDLIALLEDAQTKLDVVDPEGIRIYLKTVLGVAVATCRAQWHVLGLNVSRARGIAEVVCETWRERHGSG